MREAARWIALVNERELSQREKTDLANWLQQDPRGAAALELTMEAWTQSPQLLGDLGYGARRQGRPAWRIPAIVGGTALTACAALLLVFSLNPAPPTEYHTVSAPRLVTLADGSTVNMAPSADLAVDFTGPARAVRLVRGTADFDVSKSKRPFVVKAGDLEVQVLGTAFTVEFAGDHTTVSLRRGHVALKRGNEQVAELMPGDQATYRPTPAASGLEDAAGIMPANAPLHDVAIPQSSLMTLSSGPQGATRQVIASNIRLDRLAAFLEARLGQRIKLADADIGAQRVSGRIDTAQMEQSLERLIAPHRLDLVQRGDAIMLSRVDGELGARP